MTTIHADANGYTVAKWSGHTIRDARRGFMFKGRYLSPTSRKRQWGDRLVTIRVVDTDRKYA